MSDDTPTQRFSSPTDEVQEDLQEEKQKSKGLLIGLIIAGALLLVAIIVLVAFLISKPDTGPTAGESQSPTPDASASPTAGNATPSATSTTEPDPTPSEAEEPPANNPPPETGATFSTFNPTKQVSCSPGGPYYTPDPPVIKITWATVRADSAWIVMGTSDAADSGYMQIPLNGDQGDFQYTLSYPCPQDSATYTITLVGSDGAHVSKSWTVTNV
jgi:hypothetical protein